MKKQILTLVIGILIGAVITTGVFMLLRKNGPKGMPDGMYKGRFELDGERPDMNGERPERPDGVRGRRDKNNPENTSVDNENIQETDSSNS